MEDSILKSPKLKADMSPSGNNAHFFQDSTNSRSTMALAIKNPKTFPVALSMLFNVNLEGVPIPNTIELILNNSAHIHAISWAEHLTSFIAAQITLHRSIQVICV